MRNPFRFVIELLQRPVWIPVWMLFLMIVNVASVGFFNELLAKVIFVTFILSVMLMMGLYSSLTVSSGMFSAQIQTMTGLIGIRAPI